MKFEHLMASNTFIRPLPGTVAQILDELQKTEPDFRALTAVCQVPGVNLAEFWRHSLEVAKTAQSLADSMRLDKNLAFVAGLVHGVGDLAMKLAMPDHPCMQPEFSADSNRHAHQKAELGYSYADVGAALATQWRFPQEIVYAVLHHPDPQDDVAADSLAGSLYLASWGARAYDLGLDTPSMREPYAN